METFALVIWFDPYRPKALGHVTSQPNAVFKLGTGASSRDHIAALQQGLRLTARILNRACQQIEELSSKPHAMAESIKSMNDGKN